MTLAATRSGLSPRRRAEWGPLVGRVVGRGLLYLAVILGAALFLAPFLWMVTTSLKSSAEAYAVPLRWLPSEWRWQNYLEPWRNLPFARFYWNSAVIALLNVVGTVLTSSLVAFAFARMRFRGRGVLFVLVLSTMMLPKQVTLIPLYVMWSRLGLINTVWPLVAPAFFGHAFSIFLLRQYMMTIPLDLDDAARIDGAGWFQIYRRITLPIAAPALGVVAVFNFNLHWSEFLEPLIYLNDARAYTVPLGLVQLSSRYVGDVQQVMAQAVLSLVPVLVIFFVAQRRYVQGIVVSGLKG